MSRAAAVALALLASGCLIRRDVNAPGIVDPLTPPRVARAALETPGDPGERVVVLTPGLLGGTGFASGPVDGVTDVAAEVTVSFAEEPVSHNPHRLRDRLFAPPGLLLPREGWGATLGWSFLRVESQDRDGDLDLEHDASTGPLYVELHQFRLPRGAGAGWWVDPATGETGPQGFAYWALYHLRVRHTLGGESEVLLGVQLKWPFTWVSSR